MEAAVQGVEGPVADQPAIVSVSSVCAVAIDAQDAFRMTLGHVYDMDLRRNENLIKEVIIQAQGEVRYAMLALLLRTEPYSFQDGS